MTKRLIFLFTLLVSAYLISPKVNAATLTFDPSSTRITPGNSGSINVVIDHQGESSLGAEAYVRFDPSIIRVDRIIPSSTISDVYITDLETLGNGNGIASMVFLDTEAPFTGSFVVASIEYTALDTGTTTLSYNTSGNSDVSSVGDFDTGAELLTSTNTATITVSSDSTGGDDDDDDVVDDDDDDSDSDRVDDEPAGLPETGSFTPTLFVLISSVFFAAAIAVKRIF